MLLSLRGEIFWPVVTKHPEGAFVSYRFGVNKGDVVSGRTRAREYGAFRPARGIPTRAHDAVDLPALPREEIIACEKGTVLYRIEGFLGNTSAIYIEHPDTGFIGVYGEINLLNLKPSDDIEAGQTIGRAGITPGGYTMLHFETKSRELKTLKKKEPILSSKFRSWKLIGDPPIYGNPPLYSLNPTLYLLHAKIHGLRRKPV